MAHSRNKGKAYENQIAKLFRKAGWVDAKRHLEFQSGEAEEGRDLDDTQPFAVQAKCWKSTPSIMAIKELTLKEDYVIPVAFLKRTRSPGKSTIDVAVIPTNVFFAIISMLTEEQIAALDELDDI
jgi:hypothetical protein